VTIAFNFISERTVEYFLTNYSARQKGCRHAENTLLFYQYVKRILWLWHSQTQLKFCYPFVMGELEAHSWWHIFLTRKYEAAPLGLLCLPISLFCPQTLPQFWRLLIGSLQNTTDNVSHGLWPLASAAVR
jgi:hypothetical protein